MKWILAIVVILMLLGPLRPWFGRHWAFLLSIVGGAVFGFVWAAFVLSKVGYSHPFVPLFSGIIVAIATGRYGPAILRRIERDGKNGQSS